MTVTTRRSDTGVFYERGESLEFAYPNFTSPQATLKVLRNPSYGTAYEEFTMPQGLTETPAGRVVAAAIADTPVRHVRYGWAAMPIGWPQGQRIKSTGELTAVSTTNVSPSTDYLASLGFRTFDGTAPTYLRIQELNAVDTVLVNHDFTPDDTALLAHSQGVLRQLDSTFTTNGSTAKLRFHVGSAGEDFLVTDLHAMQADGTESFDVDDFVLDSNADGVGGGWTVFSGSPTCEWYGEDWSALAQWIEKVGKGALVQFEAKRPGTGSIFTARLIAPLKAVGAPIHTTGVVEGVNVELVEVLS